MNVYGLLYVDDAADRPVNYKGVSRSPLETYVLCAAQLSQSMALYGQSYTVLTNAPARLNALADHLSVQGLHTAVLDFEPVVPSHFRFFQAHFKISVYRSFASGAFGAFPVLLDLDVLCHRKPEFSPFDGLLVYDLTNAIEPEALESLSLLIGPGDHRWYGGEILGGSPHCFGQLAEQIDRLLPAYIARASTLPHIGDETIVSAALNSLSPAVGILEASSARILERWWSAPTAHPQVAFDQIDSAALLHLPSDKAFLSDLALGRAPEDVEKAYVRWVRRRSLRNCTKVLARRALGRKLYAPRLTSASLPDGLARAIE